MHANTSDNISKVRVKVNVFQGRQRVCLPSSSSVCWVAAGMDSPGCHVLLCQLTCSAGRTAMVVLIIIKYYAHTIHSCCQPCVQQGQKMQAQQAYALLPASPSLARRISG
jgi:hypothetical protein